MKQFMPKWTWEVCKMFGYMMFPVACFHYFNNPQFFEESVVKLRREREFPITPEKQEEIRSAIYNVKNEINLRHLKELEENEKTRPKISY